MDIERIAILSYYAALFGIGAAINFRNAHYHKHQAARRWYRLFIGSVALVTSTACLLILLGLLPSPVPVLLGLLIISGLGMCIIVIGWVEWG